MLRPKRPEDLVVDVVASRPNFGVNLYREWRFAF